MLDFKDPSSRNSLILIVVLIVVYVLFLNVSCNGYGYMGHGGYTHGPSFFYMGGPTIYQQPSVRAGSQSGPGNVGGGIRGGK